MTPPSRMGTSYFRPVRESSRVSVPGPPPASGAVVEAVVVAAAVGAGAAAAAVVVFFVGRGGTGHQMLERFASQVWLRPCAVPGAGRALEGGVRGRAGHGKGAHRDSACMNGARSARTKKKTKRTAAVTAAATAQVPPQRGQAVGRGLRHCVRDRLLGAKERDTRRQETHTQETAREKTTPMGPGAVFGRMRVGHTTTTTSLPLTHSTLTHPSPPARPPPAPPAPLS
jgi:hypothetical protein